MIFLTKMDKSSFYLNPFLIEQIIESPDIVITLTNGKKFIIKEGLDEVIARILDFWRSVNNLDYKAKYLLKNSRNNGR